MWVNFGAIFYWIKNFARIDCMFDIFQKINKKRRPITDDLLIDIYANPTLHGLAILIDRPFSKNLNRLELDLNSNDLIFVFDDEKKDLGEPLKAELLESFCEREKVKICQMNMETKEPLESYMVPLTVIEKTNSVNSGDDTTEMDTNV